MTRPTLGVHVGRARAVPAESFGEVVDDYDRLRPRVPEWVVEWLTVRRLKGRLLDLGSGTGSAARACLGGGSEVVALEPDGRMAQVLRNHLPGVPITMAVAENLPFADRSFDTVLACNAWHWFDPTRAGREVARVLKPNGQLGICWIGPDRDVDLTRQLTEILYEGLQAPVPGSRRTPVLPSDAGFGHPATAEWTLAMELASVVSLVDLLMTYSALAVLPQAERESRRSRALRSCSQPGSVTIPLLATAWRFRATGRHRSHPRGS